MIEGKFTKGPGWDKFVLTSVLEAAADAVAKHGPATCDPVRACGVLAEELGECMEQALKLTSSSETERGNVTDTGHIILLRAELCQLAGYALLQVQNIDRGGTLQWVQAQQRARQKSLF